MATGHEDDWTRQPYQTNAHIGQPDGRSSGFPGTSPQPSAGDAWDPNDYDFIPLEAAPDADAIEREAASREFKDIEPGDHELVVTGFVKAPEDRLKTGWLRGRQTSWTSASVGVRLAKASDRQATITDWFDLPPRDPREQEAYLHATKAAEGGNPGFSAAKFGHFISRLGFPFAPGAPLPAEACRLGNWIGRRVHATVAMERVGANGPRINQQTGVPYPPRTQVKLFSYRPAASAGGTSSAHAPAAVAPPSHARPAAQPQMAGAGYAQRGSLAGKGLDDL